MTSPPGEKTTRESGWFWAILKFAGLFACMAALGALAWRYNLPLGRFRDLVAHIPPGIRYAAFIGLYTLVSVAPVPARDVVKVTGAILFGGIGSTVLVYLGEMCAALAAWIMARSLGKDLIDRLLAGRLEGIQKKIEGATWWQIALLRIFPGTPYRFFNLAAPLTNVRPWPYIIGCLAGTFPRTLGFQLFFGYAGGALVDREITTFEIFLASIVFAVVALGFWTVYARFAKGRRS